MSHAKAETVRPAPSSSADQAGQPPAIQQQAPPRQVGGARRGSVLSADPDQTSGRRRFGKDWTSYNTYQAAYRAAHREKNRAYQKAYQLVLYRREPKPLERGSIAYD